MYKKSKFYYTAKLLIDIMLYGGAVCVLCVPLIVKHFTNLYDLRETQSTFSTVLLTLTLYISGILALYILYNLKSMYCSLLDGNPFVDKNVSHFRKMAVACAIISFVYVIKCCFLFTLATAIIAIVFAMGSVFCLTLKDLFKQAINYKNENDLTI